MLKKILIVIAFAFLFSNESSAQFSKMDSIATVLEHYALKNQSSVLFIHFDKNVYTNNDQVWFTGYLLKNITDLNKYTTLYLSLINNTDSSIVLQQKFLIDKGCSFGSLTLPDSLQSGNYRFVANTNVKLNGSPDAEFIQPITIKSKAVNPLLTKLALFKANDEQTGNGTVLLKVLTSDNRFIPDAEVSYVIGRNNYTLKIGKAKTSIIGEVMIDYPADKITEENNLISVSVKKGKNIRFEKFEIPIKNKNQYRLNFYPEGGYMVSNIQNKIGWEVKDLEGTAISAKAIIFSGNKVLDTIYTNSSGIGSFLFNPKYNQKYTVKLLKENTLIGDYELPGSLKSGMNIKLNSAVGDDEVRLFVESNMNSKAHLVIHNYETIYLSTRLNLLKEQPLKILLKLDSVPIGINTITLLDSAYKPVAERIFFAHYNELCKIQINTDKEEYSIRDSVKLNLRLIDKDDKPINGLVSVAMVQANRLNLLNSKNIVDYAYLDNILGALPPNSSGIKFNDLSYLDDVLLVRSWRRYKWPEKKDINLSFENKISEFEYSGSVTRGKRPLKTPLIINTIAGSNINSINTDGSGKFILPYQTLISEQKTKVWLNLNDKNFLAYDVKINDPFDELKLWLKKLNYENDSKKMGFLASGNESITSLAGVRLNEVTIKKSKDNSINAKEWLGVNACGDYVCQNRILNCPNHPVGTMPVEGQFYISNGQTIVYQGCKKATNEINFLILNGIALPKEFYIADIKNKNEPINFATVYWNYQTVISGQEDTSITFTTGDLTGEFKIIVQGVTEKDVIYGEKTIVIKK